MTFPVVSSRPCSRSTVGSILLVGALLALGGCQAGDADDGSPITLTDAGADTGGQSSDGTTPDATGSGGSDAAPTDTSPRTDSSTETDTTSPSTPDPDTGDAPDEDADETPDESPSDCTTTQRYCDGACEDVLEDPDHCGSCGFSCSDGASCVNGICKCAPGNIRCDGRCIDPTSNDDHCFDCGNACPQGKACVNSVCIEHDREATAVKLINQIRQTQTDCGQYGPKLERNAELQKAAQDYAERMAAKGFFAHEDPYDGSDFVERVSRTNYTGTALGENLSRGLRQSAERMVGGWKSSDSHCRVMANPNATEFGLGLAEPTSGMYDSYWVLLTGRR